MELAHHEVVDATGINSFDFANDAKKALIEAENLDVLNTDFIECHCMKLKIAELSAELDYAEAQQKYFFKLCQDYPSKEEYILIKKEDLVEAHYRMASVRLQLKATIEFMKER